MHFNDASHYFAWLSKLCSITVLLFSISRSVTIRGDLKDMFSPFVLKCLIPRDKPADIDRIYNDTYMIAGRF